MVRPVDLRGRRFGRWEALEPAPPSAAGKSRWVCRCACGFVRAIHTYNLTTGTTQSCGCAAPGGVTRGVPTGVGELKQSYFNRLRWRATSSTQRARRLEFTVTITELWELFVAQRRLCALSGSPLHFGTTKAPATASLDRIDSSKGYTPDNVQWVHKDINMMKNQFDQQRFIDLCRAVAAHNPNT